ncbi:MULTISPECIES: class I SAM-dependent methyltransferase [Comamonas]|jgi:cyclopropane-fatty-acyl-phospholipid synthase|uniref:Class I SAM-dependent methyltransferase n=1 Tax=Comamonas squillarum TaxID=2977320 RepID=A0ABY5ZWJ2_9BURK|nr:MULTISPECIES: class I SAM-dependent methyltransferase [Comamonas]UXC17694.1 class I SAM-dependent methyltransferase [Comamonas sp. PR12]
MNILQSKLEEKLAGLPVSVAISMPQGGWIGPPDQAQVRIRCHNAAALASLAAGDVGVVGAAIVEGHVEIEGTMRDAMAAAVALMPADPVAARSTWWSRLLARSRSAALHTLTKDSEQIQFHYDVSDDFYGLWLDPRRVYSCAYYAEPGYSLAQAQEAKLDLICRKLRLQPGERFLDVGAGWGGLLLWAAEHYGIEGTGITLSKNQHAYVNRLIEQKGLQGRVRMLLTDYRQLQVDQPFDKIASVGMFEHVGRAHMQEYFSVLKRLIKPGGLLMNHGITAGGTDNEQLGAGMGDFIEKYIFPGGELIHVSAVLEEMAHAGWEMVDTDNLRPHYAKTLWAWSDALEAQLDEALAILSHKGNPAQAAKTLRAYRLYLAGCATGFEHSWVALHQMLAVMPDRSMTTGTMPGAQSQYPFTRDYMYR